MLPDKSKLISSNEKMCSDCIELCQSVSQWTVSGPLLFSLSLNTMQNAIEKQCELVQYHDDIFFSVAERAIRSAFYQPERNAAE